MERNNEKPTNLLRHLWLLRLVGIAAAALYLSGEPIGLLLLWLEALVVAVAAVVISWLPAEMVAQALPRPRFTFLHAAPWLLYSLADVHLLVAAHAVLLVVVVDKHEKDRSWPPAVTP